MHYCSPFVGERSSVKCLGWTAVNSFSPHPHPLLPHPPHFSPIFYSPQACSFARSLVWSSRGKGKETAATTAATQARHVQSTHAKTKIDAHVNWMNQISTLKVKCCIKLYAPEIKFVENICLFAQNFAQLTIFSLIFACMYSTIHDGTSNINLKFRGIFCKP